MRTVRLVADVRYRHFAQVLERGGCGASCRGVIEARVSAATLLGRDSFAPVTPRMDGGGRTG